MSKNSAQISIGLVISIILIIGLTGLSFYFYQGNIKMKGELEKSQKQVENLTQKVEKLEKKITEETKKETTTKSEKEITEEIKKDKTADWKTYKNEEGGYMLKYPKEWNAVTSKYNSKNAFFGPGATSESGYGGVEYVGNLSPGQSLLDFVKEFNRAVEAGSVSETETTINEESVVISILPKAAIEPTEVKNVSFEKNGEVFNVYLMYKTDFTKYPEDKQRLDIFNQMLSTFRFLK